VQRSTGSSDRSGARAIGSVRNQSPPAPRIAVVELRSRTRPLPSSRQSPRCDSMPSAGGVDDAGAALTRQSLTKYQAIGPGEQSERSGTVVSVNGSCQGAERPAVRFILSDHACESANAAAIPATVMIPAAARRTIKRRDGDPLPVYHLYFSDPTIASACQTVTESRLTAILVVSRMPQLE
jgi:hypothetical protein